MERAAAAPPEIGAWLLLKQATVDRVPAKERRIALVEEAYRLAGQARLRYPLARATAEVRSDTLAGQRVEASQLHLDGLSLHVRAVLAMMSLDPAKSLQMTLEMPMPTPPRAACADQVIARVDEYYGLALRMAERGFPAKQRAEGRPLVFLTRVVAESTGPQQLLGAARMLAAYRGSEDERAALTAVLAGSLMSAPADPRAYAAVPELAEAVQRVGGLDEAYAAFVKTQEARACPAETSAEGLWAESESKALALTFTGLRTERGGDWAERFAAVLHRVESLRAEQGEDPLAFFEKKAGLYRMLLDLGPEDRLLASMLGSFADFLRGSGEKTEHPAEWLAQFRRLLQPWAPAGVQSVEMARVEIARGGDAVMSLLAEARVPFD